MKRSAIYRFVFYIFTLFFCGFGAAQANLQMLVYPNTSGGYEESTPGFTVTVWTAAQWASATTASFTGFDVLVFEDDPECMVSDTTWALAEANESVWAPLITGNVIILGTDPDYHTDALHSSTCPANFVPDCVTFAASAGTGKMGLYLPLSCYYSSATANTPVSILNGLGTFTVQGSTGNTAHKIAVNPALAGVTDTQLSNWTSSVHEGFDTWPASFVPLAINEVSPSNYTASDGTKGVVYILASGVTAIGSPTPPPAPPLTPIFTSTFTPTITNTPTITDTPTITNTPTITDTPTITSTPTNTFTITPTYTPSNTCTPTCTYTPTCVSYVWPNPYNPRTAVGGTLRFSCMNNMTVQIFTVSGELVQTVTDGNSTQPCGGNQSNAWGTYYCWNGRNKMGAPVATGIYFFVVIKKDGTVAQRGKFLMVADS